MTGKFYTDGKGRKRPLNKKFRSYYEIERAFGMSTSDAQAWAEVHPEMLSKKLREEVEMFG
ncbi:MAG: hypothetical protein JRN26_04675 [Nitrososphaerota archaeon]|jgi:hypothetical protein|nr:hypothetical protein [Nitrososphaerota archaeon]MDG6931275.1 hypothetical protein [Nitrososphaerota archaeon]MDG6936159.1 hypothetical protein [Nitrososphaerota archaeon]MDG6944061.1 hypothetical protein [Nitrososphaerota archaeon]